MNYLLPASLRDALLEYFEEREGFEGFGHPQKQENKFAAQLRDLKPLREIKEPA